MSLSIQSVSCGMIQENAYIVQLKGRDDCVVIDPGDEYPKLRRALGQRRVGAILLTHGHFDHIMASTPMAEEYGAKVYISGEDVELLHDPVLNGYEELMGSNQMTWPPIVTQPYGDVLEACGLRFEILPTPGHSKGSVCLYLRDEGVLFSGDTLFRAGYGRLDLHGGSMRDMIASLRKLFTLPGEAEVYPGHGEPTTIGEERARYRL